MKDVRCYFYCLNRHLSIKPEGAGTLVLVSVVPHTPLHFFNFSILSLLYVGLGKGLGVNEKSVCIGEPLPNFFQCVNLRHFQANSVVLYKHVTRLLRGALLIFV